MKDDKKNRLISLLISSFKISVSNLLAGEDVPAAHYDIIDTLKDFEGTEEIRNHMNVICDNIDTNNRRYINDVSEQFDKLNEIKKILDYDRHK